MGAHVEALDALIFIAPSVSTCIFYVHRLPSWKMWNCMQWFSLWKLPFQNGTKFQHAPLYCTGLSLSLTRPYLKVSVSVSVSSTSLSLSLGLEKTISKVSVSVSVSKNQIPKSQSQSRSRKTEFQSLSISLSTRNPGLVDLCYQLAAAQLSVKLRGPDLAIAGRDIWWF